MDISVLRFFESIRSGFLDGLFSFFTFFGEETFIVLAIMTLYFSVNKKLGEFMAFTVFTSATVNGILKDSVKRLRPFEKGVVSQADGSDYINTELHESYSFPSGHSQVSASFFSGVFIFTKNKLLKAVSVAAVIAVMASRIYLGVHYLSDVAVGAAIGVVSSLMWYYVFKKIPHLRCRIFLAFSVLSLISLIFIKSPDTYKALGAGLGAAIGILLENKYVRFEIPDKFTHKLLRVAAGAAIIVGLRLLLKVIFPEGLIFTFFRFMLLMFIMTFIYPAAFKKLGL